MRNRSVRRWTCAVTAVALVWVTAGCTREAGPADPGTKPVGVVLGDKWRTDTASRLEELLYPGETYASFSSPRQDEQLVRAATTVLVLHSRGQASADDVRRLLDRGDQLWSSAEPVTVDQGQSEPIELAERLARLGWLTSTTDSGRKARDRVRSDLEKELDQLTTSEQAPSMLPRAVRAARLLHALPSREPAWARARSALAELKPCQRSAAARDSLDLAGAWAQVAWLSGVSCPPEPALGTQVESSIDSLGKSLADEGLTVASLGELRGLAPLAGQDAAVRDRYREVLRTAQEDMGRNFFTRLTELGTAAIHHLDVDAALVDAPRQQLSPEILWHLKRVARWDGRIPDHVRAGDPGESVLGLHALAVLDRSDSARRDRDALVDWNAATLRPQQRLALAIGLGRPARLTEADATALAGQLPTPVSLTATDTADLALISGRMCRTPVRDALSRAHQEVLARKPADLMNEELWTALLLLDSTGCVTPDHDAGTSWRQEAGKVLTQRRQAGGFAEPGTTQPELVASWYAAEAQCLLTPQSSTVDARLAAGVITSRLDGAGGARWPSGQIGVLPTYAALRLDEIATRGCGGAWWSAA